MFRSVAWLLAVAGSNRTIDSFVRGMIRAVTSHRQQQAAAAVSVSTDGIASVCGISRRPPADNDSNDV
jgi:hypothetical protein